MPVHVRAADASEHLWRCHECGWTYPNHHPSAKHRRNHKKQCGKMPVFMGSRDLTSGPRVVTEYSDNDSDQVPEENGHHQEYGQSPFHSGALNVEQVYASGSIPSASNDCEAQVPPKIHEETAPCTSNSDLSHSKGFTESCDETSSDDGKESNEFVGTQEPHKCDSSASRRSQGAKTIDEVSTKNRQPVQSESDSRNSEVPGGTTSLDVVLGSDVEEKGNLNDFQVSMLDEDSNVQPTKEHASGAPDTSDSQIPLVATRNSSRFEILEMIDRAVSKGVKPSYFDGSVIHQQPLNATSEQVDFEKPQCSDPSQRVFVREDNDQSINGLEERNSELAQSDSPVRIGTRSLRDTVESPAELDIKIPQPKSVSRAVIPGESLNFEQPISKGFTETPSGLSSFPSAHTFKGQWTCSDCGWPFPNAHPSTKKRRKHEETCSTAAAHAGPGGTSDETSSGDGTESNEFAGTPEPLKCDTSASRRWQGAETIDQVGAKNTDLSKYVEGRPAADIRQVPSECDSTTSEVPDGTTSLDGVLGSKVEKKGDLDECQVGMLDEENIQPSDEQASGAPDTTDSQIPLVTTRNSSGFEVREMFDRAPVSNGGKPSDLGEAAADIRQVPSESDPRNSEVPGDTTSLDGVLGGKMEEKWDLGDCQVAMLEEENIQPTDDQASGAPDTSDSQIPVAATRNSSGFSEVLEMFDRAVLNGGKPNDLGGAADIRQVPPESDSRNLEVPGDTTSLDRVFRSKVEEKGDLGDCQVAMLDGENIQPTDEQASGEPDTSDSQIPVVATRNSSGFEMLEMFDWAVSNGGKPSDLGWAAADIRQVPSESDSRNSEVLGGTTSLDGVLESKAEEKGDVGACQAAMLDEENIQPSDEQASGAPDTTDRQIPLVATRNSSQFKVLERAVSNGMKPSDLNGTVNHQQPLNATSEEVDHEKPYSFDPSQRILAREENDQSINGLEERNSELAQYSDSTVMIKTRSLRDTVGSPGLDVKTPQPKSVSRAVGLGESNNIAEERISPGSRKGLVRSRVEMFEQLAGTSPQYVRN